jgi:hypothetical protein
MKTTLNLDDQLLSKAKAKAAQNGITLTRFVEDALRAELLAKPEKSGYKYRPVVVNGNGPPKLSTNIRDDIYDDWFESKRHLYETGDDK